jgi:hypothetical protein
MFDVLKGLAQQVTGGQVDPQALAQAASDHLGSLDNGQISDHLQTAAANLQANGQSDLATQAENLASQVASNPSGAIGDVTTFIQNNPQVLEHFAPDFAQGILSKL